MRLLLVDGNGILRRRDAVASGLADHEVRALYTGKGWERLGRGLYVETAPLEQLSVRERHRLITGAIVPTLSPDAVVSHASAAVLYGLPLWKVRLGKVHVTRSRSSGGRVKSTVVVHCSMLDDVTILDGIRVTTPARTVVDVARTTSFECGVVLGDAAVRRFGITPEEFAAELDRLRGGKGVAQARRVIAFLDGRSESPGESLSRIILAEAGLFPDLQVVILGEGGEYAGRTDFLFGVKVVGEFDGKIKYTKYAKPGQDPGDVVFEEKKREDGVRDLGYQMARWVWSDLSRPAVIVQRVRAALDRAATLPRPRGSVRRTGVPPRAS